MSSRIALALAPLALAALACGAEEPPAGADPAVTRGKAIYANVCIACHDRNPRADGVLGPSVAGASRELLEAKVLRGEYPPGYTPKRPSAAMPKLEYVAPSIGDVAAYLATFEP